MRGQYERLTAVTQHATRVLAESYADYVGPDMHFMLVALPPPTNSAVEYGCTISGNFTREDLARVAKAIAQLETEFEHMALMFQPARGEG